MAKGGVKLIHDARYAVKTCIKAVQLKHRIQYIRNTKQHKVMS